MSRTKANMRAIDNFIVPVLSHSSLLLPFPTISFLISIHQLNNSKTAHKRLDHGNESLRAFLKRLSWYFYDYTVVPTCDTIWIWKGAHLEPLILYLKIMLFSKKNNISCFRSFNQNRNADLRKWKPHVILLFRTCYL